MKPAILLMMTWFATNLSSLKGPTIKVTRTATDGQIKQAQQQALQQYGVKAQIKVLERNNKGEITNLTCVRYDQAGKRTSSCESDNFGALVITQDGCKIADLGYESQI